MLNALWLSLIVLTVESWRSRGLLMDTQIACRIPTMSFDDPPFGGAVDHEDLHESSSVSPTVTIPNKGWLVSWRESLGNWTSGSAPRETVTTSQAKASVCASTQAMKQSDKTSSLQTPLQSSSPSSPPKATPLVYREDKTRTIQMYDDVAFYEQFDGETLLR